MPLDPFADRARRAWIDCPNCRHGEDCETCRAGRTCARHWQYLLNNEAMLLHLQCPTCTHLWSYDTREAS